MRLAGEAGAPVVGFVESGGARLQEGHAALAGYGRIFRASVELADARAPDLDRHRRLGRRRRLLAGAHRLRRDDRGGAHVPHRPASGRGGARRGGLDGGARRARRALAQRRLPARRRLDDAEAAAWRASCSASCRQSFGERAAARGAARRRPGRRSRRRPCPPSRAASTTCATSPRAIVDGGAAARARRRTGRATWSPRWRASRAARSGLIANQPRRLGGVIDAAAAEKAALLRRLLRPLRPAAGGPRRHARASCPGQRQERGGVIRHGASLLRAFAAARVPKLTVVLRKAYGGAVITMNSKDLGADLVFAWPGAEIGIMAARQAVGIVHRRRARARPRTRPRSDRARRRVRRGAPRSAAAAAARGFVDEVIEPADDPRPPRLGARRAGAPMSAERPVRARSPG